MSGQILGTQLIDSAVTGAKLAVRWEDFRIPGSIGQIAATVTPPEFVYHRGTLGMLRVHRDNSVADNAAAGMFLFSVDFHIQMQGLGTVNSNGSGGR